MILFDATHTSHTRAQTGIQRVCRALYAGLAAAGETAPVCFDPHLQAWRPLDPGELSVLRDRTGGAGRSRGARWTLPQKISGHTRRLLGSKPRLPAASALVCPELFSARVGAHLPQIFTTVRGPRIAVFHDAIGLKFPELTPPGTVARLPAYLRELLQFDGVAAISEDSAASLRDYWRWLGVTGTPLVQAIPLGLDAVPGSPLPGRPAVAPRLLCVGTIEGRKNHLALLEACESLWREGLRFELQLLGLARPDTAGRALEKIAGLRRAGRPLVYHGTAADAELQAAYAQCSFTVYPSLAEGFGLPVLESLQHGRPCICSARGAFAESVRGGGCVALDPVDPASLARAIRDLLQNPARLADLAAAARARRFKSWADYTRELTAWMQTLPRRT